MEKKDIKKMFPHLFEELESGEVKVPINGVRKNAAEAEGEVDEYGCDETHEPLEHEELVQNEMPDKLRHFNPQAVDFLRRCDTEAQAEEIIAYLEKKGEISKEYASELRCQMKKDGVRCFGPKKEENHYFKEAGIY
ncbi:MAG: DUF2095 family protein [Candidatus Bathyarchaeia archaeon]|jgi:hypothetical protein